VLPKKATFNTKAGAFALLPRNHFYLDMKKPLFTSIVAYFLVIFSLHAQTTMLQEVITDYTNLRNKSKVVAVTLPAGAKAVFYRITTFNTEKVNTTEKLFGSLRVVLPLKLQAEGYDLSSHGLASTANSGVEAFFFTDLGAANRFREGSEVACKKIDNTRSIVGRLETPCQSEMLYVGLRPTKKDESITVKVEVVAFAPVRTNSDVDRYPFTIQNETDTELSYEISGNRINWETFFLPAMRKAEFKLAATPMYLRVSTQQNKTTVEYQLVSGKQYRLYWNKNKQQVDLGEIPKK